jgi:hypothetical protein
MQLRLGTKFQRSSLIFEVSAFIGYGELRIEFSCLRFEDFMADIEFSASGSLDQNHASR